MIKTHELVPNFIDEQNLLEQYLQTLGINNVQAFLNSTARNLEYSSGYHQMRSAAKAFMKHKTKHKKVYILMDVDCDGIFSTALMMHFCIRALHTIPYVLVHEGTNVKVHGLADDMLLGQILNDPPDMLIVPDAGSQDIKQCRQIKDAGTQTIIILDHHAMAKEPNPYAYVVNNQNPENHHITNTALSGTGVAWKFCDFVASMFDIPVDTHMYLDLVAFSILADVCDIRTLENQYIVQYGLSHIQNRGLCKVLELLKDKPITPENIVWNITPKLNAMMRFDNLDLKRRTIEYFVQYSEDFEVPDEYLQDLVAEHREQSRVVKEETELLMKQVNTNDKVNVLDGNECLSSFTGLLAGKIADTTQKPTLILKEHTACYTGSVRTNNPIFFEACEDSGLFDFVAGHKEGAFGFQLPKENKKALIEYFSQLDLSSESEYNVIKDLYVKDIPKWLFGFKTKYQHLWGTSIPVPSFSVKNIHINSGEINEIGRTKSTIRFNYQDLTFIQFFVSKEKRADLEIDKNIPLTIDVIGTLNWNVWNGYKSPQFVITKIQVSKNQEQSKGLSALL